MTPKIENVAAVALSAVDQRLLERIFARYQKIILKKEFGGGLSGGRVLEVRPVRANGAPELPTIVKLAPVSLIQQEWRAYCQHMQNRLPRISTVTDRPVLLRTMGMGGLRYAMSGDGAFEVVSLRDYCRQAEVSAEKVSATFTQLFRNLGHIWSYHRVYEGFHPRASYDQVLPVNLLINSDRLTVLDQPHSLPSAVASVTVANAAETVAWLQPDDRIRLTGFAVHKVNPDTQTMTMRAPQPSFSAPANFVRCRLPVTTEVVGLANNQVIAVLEGAVVETRLSRLYAEVRQALGEQVDPTAPFVTLPPGVRLPNPILALPHLLNQTRTVHIAAIHGDLNMDNVLIEPETGMVNLIDFADAREDHVIHDFLRLEAEVITRILPESIAQEDLPLGPTLAWLYWHLHRTLQEPASTAPRLPHPALQKPWTMLRLLRQTVRNYLCNPQDVSEYYQGLVLYLLGAMKFKNLNQLPEAPLPKQTAFWAATLANDLLTTALDANRAIPPALATLLEHMPSAPPVSPHPRPVQPVVDKGLHAAQQQLAALPTTTIAPLGALPPTTRMPFSRNGLFVGRAAELRQIAATFQGAILPPSTDVPTLVITGLGGIGKTQLATEFVHRYGRFFAGGVFWLSFADPKAVPAEVAACGVTLALRPDYAELPLEEQGRLVSEAWQSPLPRLLIFDNCEDPALLANWRPTTGGCCLLVTSRRADWAEFAVSQSLHLEGLSRTESIDLLREHRPDVESPLLDALAAEVGDLPLALHLVGSFLARYRASITPESYLTQLRAQAAILHPSLQSGAHSPTEHEQHVSRTIDLSFRQLDAKDEIDRLAQRLLAQSACLAAGEPIPVALLTLTLAIPDADVARQPLSAALRRLTELGLVRWDQEQVRLHRLVVAFIQQALQMEIATERPQVETTICTEAERLNEAGYPSALLGWQAHLRALVNAAYLEKREDILADRLWCVMGEHFRQIGDYTRARICLETSVKIRQKQLGEEHEETAQSLAGLGIIILWQGDLTGARPYLEQALLIQEQKLGEHPDTAMTLNHLGFLYQYHGDLDGARPYHTRALTMRRNVLGKENSLVAQSLCNLAYLEYGKSNFTGARAYLEQALAIQYKAQGTEHPYTALLLTYLGELLREQGDFVGAKKSFTEVWTIQQKMLSSEHPDNARILYNLGTVSQAQGDLMNACTYYENALQIRQKVLGKEHTDTASTLNALGEALQAQGEVDQARQCYERALKVFNARLGFDHFCTRRTRQNLESLDMLRQQS